MHTPRRRFLRFRSAKRSLKVLGWPYQNHLAFCATSVILVGYCALLPTFLFRSENRSLMAIGILLCLGTTHILLKRNYIFEVRGWLMREALAGLERLPI